MSTERQIYDGLRLIGIIRETSDGSFVAVLDEQIIGTFDTPRALEIARAAELSERDHLLTMATIAGGRS